MTTEEKNKILVDNLNLVHYLLKCNGIKTTDDDYEDIFQDCCVHILSKLDLHDENVSTYSTFFGVCVKTTLYHRRKKKNRKIETNATMEFREDIFRENHDKYANEFIEWIKSLDNNTTVKLNKNKSKLKHVDLVLEYYLEEKTFDELGKKYGMSFQAIETKIKKCLSKIRLLAKEKYG